MTKELTAIILLINKALGRVQITTHGARYTCPMKEFDGVAKFFFKKQWHNVDDYVGDLTTILFKQGGELVEKYYKK